jgi:ATP-dependent Lon protease
MVFRIHRSKQDESNPHQLPLLPLRDVVIFPHMVIPLFVGRGKSINALETALKAEGPIFLVAQRNSKDNDPTVAQLYTVGTVAKVLQMLRLPDGTVKVLVEGLWRARLVDLVQSEPCFIVRVERITGFAPRTPELEALMRAVKDAFHYYVRLNKKLSQELPNTIAQIEEADRLADTILPHLTVKLEEKQRLLELVSPQERLEELLALLQGEIEILEIERKIRARVKKQMEKAQREYYLSEQMRAIQKEMGEKDDFRNEIEELERRINDKKLSPEAREKALHELKKLKMMSPMSAEATVVRNYIDWILSLPWGEYTEEKLDLDEAARILEEDHYGLTQPKERILEYLAVQSLVEKMKGPILCFVGPPGVGKTSLGRSIARATGRNFVRLSLGGVRDEAEIRGHRRTYVGALPGKIIQSMRKAGSSNPVFLLDEVDKMSMDFRGDPSAALLEVLDPEQNHAFNDHYLDLDYDLSRVMFITTANTLHSIPPPLQDRMEIIRLPGYTEDEKLQIARKFLVPKQLEAHGLKGRDIKFQDSALLSIIRLYTREAGVRNLEREIATICRKVARRILQDMDTKRVTITSRGLEGFLGVPKYRYGKVEETEHMIGLAKGLAWTEAGGELLNTEVAIMPGKGKLIVTGKLGDVMQESAHAALSYVRSRSRLLRLEDDFYQKIDIHIHVPEGATPKDGPSAGITMTTAIASAILRIPVRADLAMTGEITLRGRVLPVGGLKEKILAAHRGNIRTVIIPADNQKDLKEIPSKVLRDLEIIPVEHMDEVLMKALVIDDPKSLFATDVPDSEVPFGRRVSFVNDECQRMTH